MNRVKWSWKEVVEIVAVLWRTPIFVPRRWRPALTFKISFDEASSKGLADGPYRKAPSSRKSPTGG